MIQWAKYNDKSHENVGWKQEDIIYYEEMHSAISSSPMTKPTYIKQGGLVFTR